jgi:phenylacetyl-CoA:acceptor oxidoreductase subunit 2
VQWGAASRLQRFWDLRAACNFIGGGTGCGLLFWAAIGLAGGLPYFPAALIGLMFVGAGLFMVWLEIGKPWRAFNLFFRPQTSWMTREGIVSLPLFATGAIAVLSHVPVLPGANNKFIQRAARVERTQGHAFAGNIRPD